ncbi:acyl carrier protein [Streptomyces sp. NPDC050658]|uniref:acyl carrier protein n=1 Tax=unclassified Streptomyces TaxID=2593676 RepID=UPI00343AF0A0
MTALAQRITDIMAEKFKVPADDVDVTAEFSSMALDSLDLVELTVILSGEYDVVLEDDDIEKAGTIEKTVALLRDKGVPLD